MMHIITSPLDYHTISSSQINIRDCLDQNSCIYVIVLHKIHIQQVKCWIFIVTTPSNPLLYVPDHCYYIRCIVSNIRNMKIKTTWESSSKYTYAYLPLRSCVIDYEYVIIIIYYLWGHVPYITSIVTMIEQCTTVETIFLYSKFEEKELSSSSM